LLQDTEGISGAFDDNHENVKLNALSVMTSDILIYCFKNNPSKEAMDVAQMMNNLMKSPNTKNNTEKDKSQLELDTNNPYLLFIVNKCDSMNAYINPFNILEDIVKNDSSRLNDIQNFRSKFMDVICIGISNTKNNCERSSLYTQEILLLYNILVNCLNKKAAIRKRTLKQIHVQIKNAINIIKPLNADYADLNLV